MASSHNFLKWYTRVLKSGKVRRYAREKGRYKKWEDADTLDRPQGEYKMINIVVNFIPTKGGRSTPTASSGDNFEVNLEIPEGNYSEDEYQTLGELALEKEGFSDFMIESCDVTHKIGKDFAGYSNSDDVSYKIIDLNRIQYHYPKGKVRGIIEDSEW